MLRHERQTVAVELAAALHHSWGGGLETNEGLWAQKTAKAGPAEYFELSSDNGRPAGGERPAALLEPWPQERDRWHTGVGFELVLDPVDELVDVPNVVSLPEFQQHSVEHNVDIPVRGGVGRGALMEAFAETWLRTCAGLLTRRGASLSRMKSSSPWSA